MFVPRLCPAENRRGSGGRPTRRKGKTEREKPDWRKALKGPRLILRGGRGRDRESGSNRGGRVPWPG